jgi:hypothetical protein
MSVGSFMLTAVLKAQLASGKKMGVGEKIFPVNKIQNRLHIMLFVNLLTVFTFAQHETERNFRKVSGWGFFKDRRGELSPISHLGLGG